MRAVIVAVCLSAVAIAQARTGTSSAGLYYETAGSPSTSLGAGDPVVLIHAFSVDRRMWDAQMPALQNRFTVIRYDLRGHGKSEAPSAPYSTSEDLRSVLDALGVKRAALVGLSAGAQVATDFALLHPDRVTRLVLTSPGVGGLATPPLPWMAPVFQAAGAGEPERAAKLWSETPIMALKGDTSAASMLVDIVMSNARLWTFRTNPVQPLTPPAIKRLSEIKCPTLVVVGGDDLPHIKDAANALASGITGAKLVTIPGAGHMLNFDARDRYNEELVKFLSSQTVPFELEEATIATIHAALGAGRLTCTQLVRAYLDRIDAYDHKGPRLNAILAENPRAMEIAAAMDRQSGPGSARASLHCVPVILKDNYNTADMPTTGGSITLKASIPPADAFIVKRLRDAGAIVLAKANLTELARGGTTVSSLGGQTKNPYDLTRTPGGSSGGTGAAIAANFGVVGTGSDTGQSVRSPASALSLVGLRPTRGLVSRAGIIPYSSTQDEAGPIARTVDDVARMLDTMAGYDPADPITAFGAARIPRSYTDSLKKDALAGARIGVLAEFFGHDPIHREVNGVVESAIAKMRSFGAEIVRVSLPNADALTRGLSLTSFEFRPAFNRYLASLGPRAPVKNLDEFIARGEFHPSLRTGLEADQRMVDGLSSVEYKTQLLRRDELRQAVMTLMAANRLDAILYPHQRRLVVPIGEDQVDRNGVLSNSTGFPALAFPGGFSAPTFSAPVGVPVGIELLGPEWSEPRLLELAYSFQEHARVRRPPRL